MVGGGGGASSGEREREQFDKLSLKPNQTKHLGFYERRQFGSLEVEPLLILDFA